LHKAGLKEGFLMKRVLCIILTAVLLLSLYASASAGAYTHPTAGFHLTIPEGWYPMGYTGGVYEKNGYRMSLSQIFVADGARFYEFTLTAQEDKRSEAGLDFSNLVSSFTPPDTGGETGASVPEQGEERLEAQDDTGAAAVPDRGVELMEAQDYTGALAYFDAAIAENGGAAGFHYYRGQALINLYRNEEAELAFAKAVELAPENARYLDEYGTSLIYAGKYLDAYEAIDKAVTLEPLNGEYIGDRGHVLYLLDRPGEALPELERAIELAPDYVNAYYFAAIIQKQLGAFEQAAGYCEAYLEKVPVADEMWLMLGDARMALGHYAEALAAYDGAIANGYFTAEDFGEAYTLLQKAIGEQ